MKHQTKKKKERKSKKKSMKGGTSETPGEISKESGEISKESGEIVENSREIVENSREIVEKEESLFDIHVLKELEEQIVKILEDKIEKFTDDGIIYDLLKKLKEAGMISLIIKVFFILQETYLLKVESYYLFELKNEEAAARFFYIFNEILKKIKDSGEIKKITEKIVWESILLKIVNGAQQGIDATDAAGALQDFISSLKRMMDMIARMNKDKLSENDFTIFSNYIKTSDSELLAGKDKEQETITSSIINFLSGWDIKISKHGKSIFDLNELFTRDYKSSEEATNEKRKNIRRMLLQYNSSLLDHSKLKEKFNKNVNTIKEGENVQQKVIKEILKYIQNVIQKTLLTTINDIISKYQDKIMNMNKESISNFSEDFEKIKNLMENVKNIENKDAIDKLILYLQLFALFEKFNEMNMNMEEKLNENEKMIRNSIQEITKEIQEKIFNTGLIELIIIDVIEMILLIIKNDKYIGMLQEMIDNVRLEKILKSSVYSLITVIYASISAVFVGIPTLIAKGIRIFGQWSHTIMSLMELQNMMKNFMETNEDLRKIQEVLKVVEEIKSVTTDGKTGGKRKRTNKRKNKKNKTKKKRKRRVKYKIKLN